MGYLKAGVNAGIGAARANQLDRMISYFGNGFRQFGLYRANAAFLELPAVKCTAIVLEDDRYSAIANVVIGCQGLGCQEQISTWKV